jgi:hypothetical protein
VQVRRHLGHPVHLNYIVGGRLVRVLSSGNRRPRGSNRQIASTRHLCPPDRARARGDDLRDPTQAPRLGPLRILHELGQATCRSSARPHQRLLLPQTPQTSKDSPESWQPVDR